MSWHIPWKGSDIVSHNKKVTKGWFHHTVIYPKKHVWHIPLKTNCDIYMYVKNKKRQMNKIIREWVRIIIAIASHQQWTIEISIICGYTKALPYSV